MPAWWSMSTSPRCSTPAASRRCMPTTGERSTAQHGPCAVAAGLMGVCWEAVHTVSGARRLIPRLHAVSVRSCLARHGHKHTWMGFIDVDEFLMFRWGPVQTFCMLLGSATPRARQPAILARAAVVTQQGERLNAALEALPPGCPAGTPGPQCKACQRCCRSLRGLANHPRPTRVSQQPGRTSGSSATCMVHGLHAAGAGGAHLASFICFAACLPLCRRPGRALDHFRQQRARAAAQGRHPALLHPLHPPVACTARARQDHRAHRVSCTALFFGWALRKSAMAC